MRAVADLRYTTNIHIIFKKYMKCSLFFVFLFFLYLKWLIIRVDVKKFKKIFVKCLQISKFCVPLQPQSREMQYKKNEIWCVSSVG